MAWNRSSVCADIWPSKATLKRTLPSVPASRPSPAVATIESVMLLPTMSSPSGAVALVRMDAFMLVNGVSARAMASSVLQPAVLFPEFNPGPEGPQPANEETGLSFTAWAAAGRPQGVAHRPDG